MSNLQSDEVANKVLEIAKQFDITAYTKSWNGKKQRLLAKLHNGSPTDPGTEKRSEITAAKEKIYWWIGLESPVYKNYGDIVERIADKAWGEKYKGLETRIIFGSLEEFIAFTDECLGKVDDINVAIKPKDISLDGSVVICPRCENRFKRAPRCPECGQLIRYNN